MNFEKSQQVNNKNIRQGSHRLEKVLEFDLVLKNSWNLRKVSIVLEFCKIILENMN